VIMGKPSQEEVVNWRLPLLVAACTAVGSLSLIVYSPYSGFLYLFFIAPIVSLTFVVLLVVAVVRKRSLRFVVLFLALLAFLGLSAALFTNQNTVRDYARWRLGSHRLKAEVLAQPNPVNGELRHMEWEATGFAGVANNTAYLVFDPTDLLAAHSEGEFAGLPCKVPSVVRLERHWYSVRFYTDEVWDGCPSSRAGRQ